MFLKRFLFNPTGLLAAFCLVLALPSWATPQSTWEEKPQSPPHKRPAVLTLPAKSELLALDGQDSSYLELPEGQPITLGNTRHQVVFRISDTIPVPGGREAISSRPFIISFHPVSGQSYEIQAPPLRNKKQADAFNKEPGSKIRLVSDKDDEIPYEFAVLRTKGVQIGRNIEVDIQKFNRSSSPAAVPEFAGTPSGTMSMAQENGFTSAQQDPKIYGESAKTLDENEAMSESMLRYWFEKADPATRAKFLEWASQQ